MTGGPTEGQTDRDQKYSKGDRLEPRHRETAGLPGKRPREASPEKGMGWSWTEKRQQKQTGKDGAEMPRDVRDGERDTRQRRGLWEPGKGAHWARQHCRTDRVRCRPRVPRNRAGRMGTQRGRHRCVRNSGVGAETRDGAPWAHSQLEEARRLEGARGPS